MKQVAKYHFLNVDFAVIKFTVIAIFGLLTLASLYFISKGNVLFALVCVAIPIPVYLFYLIFKYPRIGFITSLFCNYFAIGLTRYIPAPLGLMVDASLVLTFVALIFSQFNQKVNWGLAAKDYTVWVVIWAIMTFLQLFNPEAISREAWFYAMRGYAVYSLFTVPMVYILFNKPADFNSFIKMLAWFTLVAVAVGLKQKYIGLDSGEKKWLMIPGNYTTHLLFGQLRVFSIFADAGTYGSSMGYFGVLYIILGIHERIKKDKYFYFFVGLMSLYAMMISGTRSAIAVPLVGFVVYTVLTKRFKVIVSVGVVLFAAFFFLKYTTIGQGNYDIRRMRSAFSEDNASMNVRYENRRMFAEYLATRPFGGGVGSAGNWGMRFTPGTFLAETATDGWYIQIWAEQGIVGLTFYLAMILYIAIKSCFLIFFRLKKPEYINKAIGFTAGMFGLMVSSYTAASLGQMPNTIIVFTSMTLISLMPQWEKAESITVDTESNELILIKA